MTITELITITALAAALAVAGYYLLARGGRVRADGARDDDSLFIQHRRPLVAGPDGHPLPQWGLLDVLAVILVVFAGFVAAGFLASALLKLASGVLPRFDREAFLDTPGADTLFIFIQWAVMVSLPLLYLRARDYRFDRHTFGFRRTNPGYALGLWLAVMFACYIVIPTVYTAIVENYQLYELPQQEVVEPFGLTWGGFIIALITVAVATPVIEEFFFRGVIFQGLQKQLGFFLGAVLSSGLFALAHYPYWGLMPILFSIGFGFAILLRATGSLWPPIVGHFAVNVLAVVLNFKDLFKGIGS